MTISWAALQRFYCQAFMYRTAFILCFVLAFLPATGHAGAWLKPEGSGEVVLTSTLFHSDGFYDRRGNEQSQPDFYKYEINPYVEYGLTPDWTIGGNLFLHYVEQDSLAGSTTDNLGLADTELFARRNLLQLENTTFALQPLIKLPSLYSGNATPRSGSDAVDAELSLLAGHAFAFTEGDTREHYAELRTGYRHRTDSALEDQLRIDAKAGLALSKDWQFIPAIISIWTLNDSTEAGFSEDGQNNYHLVKIEAMLRHDISEKLYLQGGAFSHVYGRNAGSGSGMSLGLGLNF